MRIRYFVALLALSLSAAQNSGSVGDLVAQVRSQLARNRGDSQLSKDLRKFKLAERLDDRTIETLQSEGAGPETVAQLLLLRDQSADYPAPAKPAIPEPAAPPAEERVQIWNAAHENALSYTDGLPDFICSEEVKRYSQRDDRRGWHLDDTLLLRLTYFDHREDYKLMSVNNHATGLSYEQINGAITEGEFGSMLAAIFALKSRTNRDWDHWTVLRSRPAHVYTFSILAANSDYGIAARGAERVSAGQHGYVYIDDATRMVVRITAITDGLPADFPVRKVNLLLDYGFTEVGGKPYLLPLHSETTLDAPPERRRNLTDFLAYRKFSSDTTITYGAPGK